MGALLIDETEVFRVTQIGRHIDRRYMTIDHGGTETRVSPQQLNYGMGMFTLLDGYQPANTALVRLSATEGFYSHPATGSPTPPPFVDPTSNAGSRLFGQGAELRMRQYVVSSRPST